MVVFLGLFLQPLIFLGKMQINKKQDVIFWYQFIKEWDMFFNDLIGLQSFFRGGIINL